MLVSWVMGTTEVSARSLAKSPGQSAEKKSVLESRKEKLCPTLQKLSSAMGIHPHLLFSSIALRSGLLWLQAGLDVETH